MAQHIIEEAKRCLQCKNPKCSKGCPVNTPIKEAINLFLNGEIFKAGEKLFLNNPLSSVCSLVCPHEKFCEGSCILSNKGNPIHWSSIEHYISDYYLNKMNIISNIDPNKKIAIVGSGPAGITIAFILASRGYDITIFELHDKIGGVLRYGIPAFRLPKDILDRLEEQLIKMGVKIRPNTLVGPVITIDDLFRDGYKAVFIGTGVWNPRPLRIKGESLGNVHYAIDYLKNPDVYNLGKKLCIIGAGNVAIDVARTALRKGVNEVYIMYRKGKEDMSANKHDIEYAKLDGVKFEFYKTPIEIIDREGVKYLKTKKVKEDGEEKLIVLKDSEGIFKADSIIIAVSQGPKANIVLHNKGIEINKSGLVITDECGRTTREGIFASGDVVTGAKTVVEAVKFSKKVADAIDEYVSKNYGGIN
ncbi:glutamate synthase (NADPH/NADH) small chain [Caminicella sporogenes DSM 14501]|uniref:Glutamate synthase (NADPH/NADH) small chain n=1 Tax=Caminicella sporogenes DSM 14501 TaxID=1121266 RepID=A0A1M6SRP9_9FIRM|nr:NAD(P)-dependent oxidoreductase [Caminicella sporogenes]RKD26411.1 dihydropyrimidine dehydrogenase [Caminicella sporogenes]WIF95628.1 NAD(P)-dependent oxidoreductase [Caminicella sporogenes]SHK47414.1 glutamate synthase (NADPH/NADH) small chain [Caminicella sporogenes DSM 14501]